MSDQKMAILRMLEEGKITADEAARLLSALGAQSGEPAAGDSAASAGDSVAGDDREKLGAERDLFDNLGHSLGRVFKAVQEVDVDRVVRTARESASEAVSSVRDSAGKRVHEVMEEVADVVSEVTGRGEREEVVEEEECSLPSAGVTRLRAETGNGPVSVTSADTDQVTVTSVTRISGRDLAAVRAFSEQVEVAVEQVDDEIRVSRSHPRPPAGVLVTVGFDIRCPASLHCRVYTLNGKVGIRGTRADIDAASSNGEVTIEGGVGAVNARTKNGPVRAVVEELRGRGEFESINGQIDVEIRTGQASLQAKTLNGSVNAQVPAAFDGQLDAHTTNGRVSCHFPIPASDLSKKNRVTAPLGRGGDDLIRLHTLNGGITLKPVEE